MISMSNPKTENLIPFEIEGEITYLNPNSAEGKALQRMKTAVPEQFWSTHGTIGEEIDVDLLNKRLQERGYSIQVSFQDSSES